MDRIVLHEGRSRDEKDKVFLTFWHTYTDSRHAQGTTIALSAKDIIKLDQLIHNGPISKEPTGD